MSEAASKRETISAAFAARTTRMKPTTVPSRPSAGATCAMIAITASRRSSRPTSARPCESTASRSRRAESRRCRIAVATTDDTGATVSSQIASASSALPPERTFVTPLRKSS